MELEFHVKDKESIVRLRVNVGPGAAKTPEVPCCTGELYNVHACHNSCLGWPSESIEEN